MVALSLVSCKQNRLKEPELLDPAYRDLVKARAVLESDLKKTEAVLGDHFKKWREAPPQSGLSSPARSRYFKEEKAAAKYRQMIHYYDLRISGRKVWARKSYADAYSKEQVWPDPTYIEKYENVKKLTTASKNWQDRVPSLYGRINKYQQDYKKAHEPTEAEKKAATEH